MSSAIAKAFRELRKLGYTAKRRFWCCNTCGWYDLGEQGLTEKAVFLHSQAEDAWRERGMTYLSWSGNGQEIFEVMQTHGLRPVWNGSEDQKIGIHKEEYPQELIERGSK